MTAEPASFSHANHLLSPAEAEARRLGHALLTLDTERVAPARISMPMWHGTGLRLREGMVFTIEPMLNQGSARVRIEKDGWTVVTSDGKRNSSMPWR